MEIERATWRESLEVESVASAPAWTWRQLLDDGSVGAAVLGMLVLAVSHGPSRVYAVNGAASGIEVGGEQRQASCGRGDLAKPGPEALVPAPV